MQVRRIRSARWGLFLFTAFWLIVVVPLSVMAAPYAAYVIDARTGEVLHSQNADARLHPASLTKMMTLYIAFEAVENGEISLDTKVKISSHAASEPPSKLGLRAGQTIALRYLIRAAAVKSANDAATAIGEAISGSESAFAKRMTRTARSLGMNNTTFKNANGLTADGHLSSAHDMTILGRHLLYDFPQYYNLFSRTSADAGIKTVPNTNRRLLADYRGADGIKTGYTRAAGFNLVASAERGNERIIATVFGGTSTSARNARVAELLDLGFRKAPSRAPLRKPDRPRYVGNTGISGTAVAEATDSASGTARGAAGKTVRVSGTVQKSPRPQAREIVVAAAAPVVPAAAIAEVVAQAVAADTAQSQAEERAKETAAQAEVLASIDAAVASAARPPKIPEAVKEIRQEAAAAATQDEVISSIDAAVASAARPPVIPEPIQEARAASEDDAMPDAEAAEIVMASAEPAARPEARPTDLVLAASDASIKAEPEREIVTRLSTSGGQHWGINVGRYNSRYEAEKVLLRTALAEMATLDGSLRKVVQSKGGFDANFLGMTRETADLACRRLQARNVSCFMVGPPS